MKDIYQEELMDIYKHPTNRGHIKDASAIVHHKNPMCGDELDLSLKIENNVIKDAKFQGSLCAVSIISSDILLSNIIGKTVREAKEIQKEDLISWLNINLSTSRIACATLVLSALQKALKDHD